MDWLQDVLDATAEAESPRSFFWWAGACAIASTVKNQVYLDKFYYKLFPNMFVFIVAPSGLRKGAPVDLCIELVKMGAHTRVIAGRSSAQAIVNELGKTHTKENGDAPLTEASALIASGEFSSSIVRDPDALTILTNLYDGHYNKEYSTYLKSMGTETIKGVNITLFGGLNETHFNDLITEKEISGGFMARTLVVYERKRALKNSLVDEPEKLFVPDQLAVYLKEMSKVKGKFAWSPDAKKLYKDWYMEWDAEGEEDKTGLANRIHDHILKVAMIISLSQSFDLILRPEHIIEAKDKCFALVKNLKRITQGSGKSATAPVMQKIVATLLAAENYRMGRSKLLSKLSGTCDYIEFDKAIETLIQSRIVKDAFKVNDELTYELTPQIIIGYSELANSEAEEEKEDVET